MKPPPSLSTATARAPLAAPLAYPLAARVHGLNDALAALAAAEGRALALISAPGAALYGGIGWWQAMIAAARAAHPGGWTDILDCADASGLALAALRAGQQRLILWPPAPGRAGVAAIAAARGAHLLAASPPALDFATPPTPARLAAWFASASGLG